MIDIYKERNLLKLWLASFDVSNKMIVPFLKVFLIAFLPMIVVKLASFFLISSASSPAGLVTVSLGSILLQVITGSALLLGYCALVRLCAAYVEGRMETIGHAFLSSFVPFLYLLILSVLLSIVSVVIFAIFFKLIFFAIGSSSSSFIFLILLLISFFFIARLFYVPAAIILKEKGPFSAIQYSWELTEGMNALYSLGAFILMSLIFALPSILIVLAYELIPLYAPSLNLAGLPMPVLISLLIIFLCLLFFFQACGYVFYTLVFVHIDNEGSSKQWASAPDMHIVKKHQPDIQMTTDDAEVTFHEEETIRLNSAQVQELTVESTAVKAGESNKHLKEELKKVYKPQSVDKLVQHGDEDRMPTIVFDDEMAKNLEESKKLLTPQPQQPQDKPDNDDGEITSIKISK
ncbi:MAG: hypothetical protein J5601_02965 [Elusimicrobiaceae bacterium]|nr:hypothetical protein [Elusimicrobiaceae bacterium]